MINVSYSMIKAKGVDNLKVKIEVFLETSDIEAIETLAKEEGISRSNWIRDAVLEKLEREGEYRNNKVLEESNV
jgi:metal-responsive CopG/Arc/MetJ family transcriptional regulator